MAGLTVIRLRVRFHYETRHPCQEVVSLTPGYTTGDVQAACAATQGWPFEAWPHVVLDEVEELPCSP